jgi:hypothetical protein
MASGEIDRQLHQYATDNNMIGAWADGAENSVMTTVSPADWDKLRVSAAMKGYLADQKQTLIFQQNKTDKAALYEFQAKGSIDDIHSDLLKDGVAFHTIVPNDQGATVYVVDLDGSAHDAVDKAATRYDTTVTYQLGKAEFLGTTKEDGSDREQRDDARRAYEQIIKESPVQGSQGVWRRVHNRWGETLDPDNDSFVRESNGEQAEKLLNNEDFLDMTQHADEGIIGYLTPEGEALDIGGIAHTEAARQSGTTLDDLLEEGAARMYLTPHDVIGVQLYHRPSEQQWNFLKRSAIKVKPERFVIDGAEGYAGTTEPGKGEYITPRDMLAVINKTFPVRVAAQLKYWTEYFKAHHAGDERDSEYWSAYFKAHG